MMPRYFRNIVSAIILCIIAFSGVYAGDEWMVTSEGWVSVYHHEEDADNVEAIISAIYYNYPQIRQNLGLRFSGDLTIHLAAKPAEFGELTGWKLPAWSQGVAFVDKKMVVLKSPKYSGSQVDLAKASVHEFIHIIIATDVGRIPLWLNEGLAVMLSGEGYFDDRPLTTAAITGNFIPFREMERVLKMDPGKAQLAYQQSLAVTRYFVSEFGWERVGSLLRGVRSGLKFDDAFMDATGLWPDEFENEWLKLTGGKYKYSILKDLNTYVGYLFIPLVLLGGLLAYIRRRRVVRRWEQEEQYFDYGD